ncbi:MAG: hypothetical protein OXD43_05305 [Bacteroidetes bacterium]|nr:hypothetical protein [Bacteroidota bacterium]
MSLPHACDGEGYIEWQAYGKVTLDDIEEITVSNSLEKSRQLRAALEKAGYDHIEVKLENKFRGELGKMERGDLTVYDSFSPVDIDNFSKDSPRAVASHNGWLKNTRLSPAKVPSTLRPLWSKIRDMAPTDSKGHLDVGKMIKDDKILESLLRDYLREY